MIAFSQFFIILDSFSPICNYSYHIFGIEGTFLTEKIRLTLLLKMIIDTNDQVLVFDWVIVERENLDSWNWFLYHLCKAIPDVTNINTLMIFKREKVLKKNVLAMKINQDVFYFYHFYDLKKTLSIVMVIILVIRHFERLLEWKP